MKRADLIFTSILVPVDFAMLILAGMVSYFLRFQAFSDVRPVLYEIAFPEFLHYTILAALGYLLVFAISGLYEIGFYRIKNEIPKVITACSSAILIVVLFIFFIPDLFSSRFIVLAFWALSIVFIITARLILRTTRYFLLKKGIGVHKVALIGREVNSKKLYDGLSENVGAGYKVVARVSHLDDKTANQLSQLANTNNLEELFKVRSRNRCRSE